MAYTRLNWVESETPLSADNMNNIEDGIEELQSQKVDKVSGKALSDNNYTSEEKTKLAGIEEGAEVNVQPDWNQTDTSADDYINNKPGNATTSTAGFMSASDKSKLNGIEAGAQVNPGVATTSANGLMSSSDKTKLNGIEIFSLTARYSGSFTLSAFEHKAVTFSCTSTQCSIAAIQAIQLPTGVAIGGIEKQMSSGNLIGIIVRVYALNRGVTVSNPTATLLVIRNAVQ